MAAGLNISLLTNHSSQKYSELCSYWGLPNQEHCHGFACRRRLFSRGTRIFRQTTPRTRFDVSTRVPFNGANGLLRLRLGGSIVNVARPFIDRYARKAGKNIRRISKRTLELLQAYQWPGNIRELQNIVERSVIACETENFSIDESWLSRRPHGSDSRSQPELSKKRASVSMMALNSAAGECTPLPAECCPLRRR
jgi:hypothetical protein